jgi:hypothetical protein
MPSIINASSSGSGGLVQTADASGVLQLQSNGTLALATSGANVAIGGSSPSAWNSVWKALDISVASAVASSSSGTDLWQNAYESASSGPLYKVTGFASIARASSVGGFEVYTAPSGSAGAAVTFTRALQLGPSQTLALAGASSVSGTGITFPAIQNVSSNANTLDDYEEGTWTPALHINGNITGITYNLQTGRYVKIGRTVIASFNIELTSKGGLTGIMNVGGLPFPQYTSQQYSASPVVCELGGSGTWPTGLVYAMPWSDSFVYLRYLSGSGYIDTQASMLANNGKIFWTGVYETTN